MGSRTSLLATTARWLDDRFRLAEGGTKQLRKAFPAHWSYLFGEVALFSLVVLFLTGTFLALFYTPDTRPVVYAGPYEPLQGAEVSAAFDSTMRLSFEVQAGLLMRQIHHWAALVFVASILVHMLRVFFTGAFRKPREINWVIGVVLLILALAAGFTGYSLPDDLLSGTGLRIAYGVVLSVPFVGPLLAFLLLGGPFPGEDAIGRLYVMHIMILPALLTVAVGAHLAILWRQKHTHKPGPGRTERNVVGEPFFPGQTLRSLSLFAFVVAILALLGGVFEINPVWLYGPYEPFTVFAPAQPDWYIGWLEGLLRIWPPWEFTLFGVTIASAFLPGVVVPGAIFGVVMLWPWIEARWITRDSDEHHLNQRLRDVPARAAWGLAGLTFMGVLFVAGSNDIIAANTGIALQAVTTTLQVSAIVLPLLVGWVTHALATRLAARPQSTG